MKVIFAVLFLLMISSVQAISNEDIQSNEQAHELNGNLDGNRSIEGSKRLNRKDELVETQNEDKHELSVTIRKGGGGRGGGRGGSGRGGGGKGGGGFGGGGGKGGGEKGGGGRKGGGGFGGGVAGGIIGGYIGGTIANGRHHGGYNGGYDDTQYSATTLSARPHFCVSTLILCMSFWLLNTLFHFH